MIEADKRKAIFLLNQEGMSEREISRRMGVSRSAVAAIIAQAGAMPQAARKDKMIIDPELLRRLHAECDGWIQRVHEKLVEEEKIAVSYPTLTRMLRALGIGASQKERCDRVPDEPGAEFQHDTSVYTVKLGDKQVRVIASLMYLRYSKRRFLKFYRAFNRFKMKCFFHEALMFWGCAAKRCVIDNTNLARLRGLGRNAVIVPEMEAFGKQYGFVWLCHEKGHPNRKAGEERSFWTVETNFLPGRAFADLEDLNRQALEWSTVRMEHRPQGAARLIPAKAFEHERAYLVQLTPHFPAPYLVHPRGTDQYGYARLYDNFYWVPGTKREDVKVLEYGDRLKIFQEGECRAEYPLPADGVKNERFSPPGMPAPRHHPPNCRQPTQQEEQRLRALGPAVGAYLDFALKPQGIERHGFIRKLFALSRKITAALFIRSLERAHKYQITNLSAIERIVGLCMSQNDEKLPCVEVDEQFQEREAYQQGRLTDSPDLSMYENMLEESDE